MREYIKTDLKCIVKCGVKWIRLAKDRAKCRAVVNTEMDLLIA
jgi:hypothetical protein